MSENNKSPWNSLEVAKLLVAFLTPLLLALIAYLVNQSFRTAEETRKQQEVDRQLSETRRMAIQNLSRFIYERRIRAELLASALRRNAEKPVPASMEELIKRKSSYDEAYANWGANHQANLLLVRQVLGANEYSEFERLLEFRLVRGIFAPLDACLTRGYDRAIRGGDPNSELKNCHVRDLLQRALDCGYAITDILFKLASAGKDQQIADKPVSVLIQPADRAIVNERCPEN